MEGTVSIQPDLSDEAFSNEDWDFGPPDAQLIARLPDPAWDDGFYASSLTAPSLVPASFPPAPRPIGGAIVQYTPSVHLSLSASSCSAAPRG